MILSNYIKNKFKMKMKRTEFGYGSGKAGEQTSSQKLTDIVLCI